MRLSNHLLLRWSVEDILTW